MRTNPRLSLFVLFWSATAFGAGTEIIGTAGSVSINADQVRALLARQSEQSRRDIAADPAAIEQLVRADLTSRALVAEANAAGFSSRPDVVAALEQLRDVSLVRMWLATRSQVPESYPAEADIKSAYEQTRSQLRTPVEYHTAQIFISAPDGIEAARISGALRKLQDIAPKISSGGDFAAVARASSEHQESAGKGGDLGWIPENRLQPAVAAAVQKLKPGESTGPIKTEQGFHFVKLLEIKPGREPTLDEAREQLASALRARRAQELAQQYEVQLAERLTLSVNQIALAALQKTLTPAQVRTGKDGR
jgi:peptidylprolyl isomerase